ncbi:MAG: acetate--CoA ligase family protein [Deltaproteobacteria bacterium]|nr:acetate--CoA ligase family protein [Deltaproteobacteria bacterium]
MSRNSPLECLFEADRVAIIGASERNHYAATIFRNLQKLGFETSQVVPVNPNRPEVFGLKAYPSLVEVPGEIPLAVVATNAKSILSVMRQLGEKGVKGAIVLADGFREAGEEGKALQLQLTQAAREMGLQLVGPNCMGLVSVPRRLGLWAGELPRSLRAGNVACVFQSSGMLNLFLSLAGKRGVGLHFAVSGGNEAVLTASDYLTYAADCPQASVIVMFMEAAADPQKLTLALDRALANGKSVIILRAGRTERAKRNVIAHTGNLAGSAAAWDALLDQHGAILVNDLDDLIETTVLFSSTQVRPDPHERGVALATISGGDCTLLCDMSEQEGIPLPELSPETLQTMVEKLDKPTLVGNPLDVENLQRQNEESFNHCLATLFQEPRVDTVGVRLNLPNVLSDLQAGIYERIASLRAVSDKRVVVFSRASEPLADEWYALFGRLDLPFVQEYRKGLRALARLRRSESERADGRFVAPERPSPRPTSRLRDSGVLSFAATAAVLNDYGIPLAPWRMARSADEAIQAAETLGFPCVLKLSSVDVPHKTEYGALALGLNNTEDVRTAYQQLLSRVREKKPDAKIEGVMVQPQLRGVECLLGISRDPQLGPVLVLGLGGILVEVLKDVALRIPPITAAEARRALESLRGRAILRGFRGSPPADVDALAETASRLSWLAYDLGEDVLEIDLNPVLVLPAGQGAVAVDALIVTRNRPE